MQLILYYFILYYIILYCRILEENEVQILVDEDWDENLLNYQATYHLFTLL